MERVYDDCSSDQRTLTQDAGVVINPRVVGDIGAVNNLICADNVHVNFSSPTSSLPNCSLSDECAPNYVQEFKRACQLHMERLTEEKVAKFRLQEPDEQVFPKMVHTEFYTGATVGPERYIPDATFAAHNRRVIGGSEIGLEEIHEGCSYAALVADAGAGKTTLAKRYARAVSRRRITSMNGIELVHYVRFADLDCGDECTVFDLLFLRQLRGLSEAAKKYGRLWVEENGKKILLVLDGLDQATWVLNECGSEGYSTRSTAPNVIYNVLHKNLLGGCKILLTSREHTIRSFNLDSRPQKIIALDGLSQKSINILIKKLAPEKGEEIIQHLTFKSPGLRSICVNPMFLIFTVAVLSKGLSERKELWENASGTMSGVSMSVLWYFLSSENRRVDDIFKVMEKLTKMAFDGTSRRSVLFTEEDLHSFDLSAELVQDLVMITPEKGVEAHYKLMEGVFRLFFCHPSVQEALSAIELSKQSPAQFKKFVDTELHKPHWAVVLRILLGITLNDKTAQDAENLSRCCLNPEHRNTMRDWIERTIVKNQETSGKKRRRMDNENVPSLRLEDLCTLLYECGDAVADIIGRNVHNIVIGKKLHTDQAHAVTWVMSHCKRIQETNVKTGGVSERLADQLANGFRKCAKIKIDCTKWSLWVNEQKFVHNEENGELRRVEKINFAIKDVQKEPVDILSKLVEGTQTDTLKIEAEPKQKTEPFMTKDQFYLLKDVNAKVKVLDFSRKHPATMSNTSKSTFTLIGEVAKNFKVEKLLLKNFLLNKDEWSALDKGLEDHVHKVSVETMEGVRGRKLNEILGGEENFQNAMQI